MYFIFLKLYDTDLLKKKYIKVVSIYYYILITIIYIIY